MSETPVVITGLAAISSAGIGVGPLMAALRAGRRCFQPVPAGTPDPDGEEWAPASAFRVADFMPPLKARKFDRCSQFAIAAAGMAFTDAGIDVGALDSARIGIVLGCGFGGITNSEEFLRGYFSSGADGLIPMLFPNTVANAAASNTSIELKFRGPNVTIVQRFCSAESALFMARRFLEEDRADIMLAGGVDEITRFTLSGFRALGQLRPGGLGKGFTEGSGMVVLEREEHAVRRAARIRARVTGISTVGLLPAGVEHEGLTRLLSGYPTPDLISLSGAAPRRRELAGLFPGVPRLDTGTFLGRSLAMGGIALTALLLSLPSGSHGLHLAASPEGPWYAAGFQGVTSTCD
jgi:3-oxoacyl-(acyl-carrier-protein) synthase